MQLELLWQDSATVHITTNLFGVKIPMQNIFIAVLGNQVIWMFLFQSNFSSGAVQSADEKHLSPDNNVVDIVAKYLTTSFCKNY